MRRITANRRCDGGPTSGCAGLFAWLVDRQRFRDSTVEVARIKGVASIVSQAGDDRLPDSRGQIGGGGVRLRGGIGSSDHAATGQIEFRSSRRSAVSAWTNKRRPKNAVGDERKFQIDIPMFPIARLHVADSHVSRCNPPRRRRSSSRWKSRTRARRISTRIRTSKKIHPPPPPRRLRKKFAVASDLSGNCARLPLFGPLFATFPLQPR